MKRYVYEIHNQDEYKEYIEIKKLIYAELKFIKALFLMNLFLIFILIIK